MRSSRASARGAAVRDVGHLLRFRASTVRRPLLAALALTAVAVVTAGAAVLPAWLLHDGPRVSGPRVPGPDLAALLPAAFAAIVAVSIAGAVAAGGGRELLARDPAAIHPVSPVTDHLGALLLAPLSAGWLVQAWALLGLSSAVAGPARLPAAVLVTALWLVAATALGQAVAWGVERVRRGRRGVVVVRIATAATVALLAAAGATPDARGALVAGPARAAADVVADGSVPGVLFACLLLALATGLLVVTGGRLAVLAARRAPRDEGRVETRSHAPRRAPRSDLAMLRRIDRASVWRSVPLRRGTWLLAVAPGAVALAGGMAGGMAWSSLVLLPGLVASGCVLLFGVNLWCLDGRGLLWRETLPVRPATVLAARAWVLAELLLGAGLVTLLLGAVRAGRPTPAEALAVVLVLLVVVGQALSAALRWSAARPHAVDLRSARATPAPPLVMVGYSLRLAVATTLTGLLFSGLAAVGRLDWLVAAALPFLLVSGLRVARAARRWTDPVARSGVVAVVAA